MSQKAHKIESRNFTVKRSYCVQPGCKFNGDMAAQGVCFSVLDKVEHNYITDVLKQGEDFLKEVKSLRMVNKQSSKDAWIKYLEGHIVCQWANSQFTLDELIHLRAENAKLRVRLGKWPRDKVS